MHGFGKILLLQTTTATDATTGDLFYVSVKGEKIPLEDSPETNVLLYELFKQDVGRGGEALETIKDLNIQQFQQAPASAKFSDKNPFDDRFNKDLEKARDTIGTPKSSGFFGRNEEQDMRDRIQELELQAARGMASPRDGSFLGEEARRNASVMATRAEQLRSQLPEADKRDFYSYRRKDKSRFGFGDKGQNDFVLTPTGLTQREVLELTRTGDYEIGPAELAKEIRGDDIDREEEFMRKAILAGRVPMPGTQQQVAESKPVQEKVLIETEEQVPNNFRHKTFVPVEISGLYSRGSKDNLKFRVRMLEDKNTGEVKYVPDVNLAPIITEIYQAENYSQESKEEIGMIKDLVSADNIGLAQRVNDLSRSIAAIAGVERIAFDENGNQIMPTPEIIARWAKRFTAQNITTILGESNRTISDADRKRADDIVNVLGTFTDVAGAKLALEQLINIFEAPSRNANSALQSLYAQGESSGYLEDIKDIERSVLNQLQKGGGAFSIPKSSAFWGESNLYLFIESRRDEMLWLCPEKVNKIIVFAHGQEYLATKKTKLIKKSLYRANHIISSSNYTLDLINNMNITEIKKSVIPPTYSLKATDENNIFKQPTKKVSILSITRLEERKGIIPVLKSLGYLHKEKLIKLN